MIRRANERDLQALVQLALKLWPHNAPTPLQEELREILSNPNAAVFFLSLNDVPIAFAHCQLRHDYVEGTNSSPVGYLEAVYVDANHRRQGIASALLHRCEAWAGEMGCSEFASDCEQENTDSLRFHLGVGFTEANRVICFKKTLSHA